MTRSSLRQILSSALLAALAVPCSGAIAGCGGSVVTPAPGSGDGGTADATGDSVIIGSDTGVVAETGGPCSPSIDTAQCSESVTYPCGLPITLAGANPTATECETLCEPLAAATGQPFTFGCGVWAEDSGTAQRVSCASCAIGRRPADLCDGDGATTECDPVADALAEMARIEAASVHAFRRLASSLAELEAPSALRSRARDAARDEIRHARIVSRIAKKRGAARRRVVIDRTAPRATTYALALENAVEGCVKETLGVAYLAHQAEHGADPELRAMAASLYEDELAHASLSWDLVPFFDAHLGAAERASLRDAQRRALEEVVREADAIDPAVRTALGVPSGATVARLVEELRGRLYA